MTPENVMSFSALVYFFAKDVYQKTKVPVGIINSSVGGSPVEAWISEGGLKPFPFYLNEKRIYESDDLVESMKKEERKKVMLGMWRCVREIKGCMRLPLGMLPIMMIAIGKKQI